MDGIEAGVCWVLAAFLWLALYLLFKQMGHGHETTALINWGSALIISIFLTSGVYIYLIESQKDTVIIDPDIAEMTDQFHKQAVGEGLIGRDADLRTAELIENFEETKSDARIKEINAHSDYSLMMGLFIFFFATCTIGLLNGNGGSQHASQNYISS